MAYDRMQAIGNLVGHGGKGYGSSTFKKCSDDHGKLPIVVDGKTYYVQGGSCTSPGGVNSTSGVDIIVGLDMGMQWSSRQYPWVPGTEFLYRIQDMSVPDDIKTFMALLDYLAQGIVTGSKVFVGCIGGHGRTGLVLSALLKHMTGEADAITVVRQHVCKKCVESDRQVQWLGKHFGIKAVPAYKSHHSGTSGSKYNHSSYGGSSLKTTKGSSELIAIPCLATPHSVFSGMTGK